MAIGGGLQLPALVQRIVVDASGASQADAQIGGFASKAGSAFTTVAKGAIALAGVGGIGAIGVSVVKTGAEFSKSLNAMAAVAGVPGPELEKLRQLAVKLGADTTFSANEAASGMLELAKAGISTADIMGGALANTLSLATAGELELADAATVVGQAMNTFNLTGKDSQRVVDALAGAANSSSADVSDLSQALSQGGQAAAMAGLTIEETTAALALFADNGLRGSDAGTSLKTALLNLVPTTKQAKEAMAQYGLEFVNADGSIKSLVEIQGELKEGLGGLTDAQQQSALKTIFGTDAYRAMGTLLNSTEGELQGYIDATSKAGTASEVAEARMKGLPGILERISGGFETVQLGIYQLLEPAFIFLGSLVAGLLEKISGGLTAIPAVFASVQNAVAPTIAVVREGVAALITAFEEGDVTSVGFVGTMERIGVVLRTVADFVTGTVVPAVQRFIAELRDRLAPVIDSVAGFIRDNLAPILSVLGGLLGGSLLGAVISIAGVLGGVLLAGITAVGGAILSLVGVLVSPIALLGALAGAAIYAYTTFEGFRNVVDAVVQFVVGAFSSLVGFVTQHWGTITSVVSAAIETVRDVVVGVVSEVVAFWVSNFTTLVSFVAQNWDSISTIIGVAINAVKIVVTSVIGVILTAWRLWGDELVSFIRITWDFIKGIVQAALDIVLGVIQTVLAIITGDWTSAWEGIKQILSGAWELMKTIVTTAINIVREVIEAVLSVIRALWDAGWSAISDILSAAWDFIKGMVSASIESVRSTIDSVLNTIRGLWDAGWTFVRSVVSDAWESVKGTVTGGINAVKSVLDSTMGAIRGAWDNAWNGMKSVVQGALDGIRSIWNGISGAIGGPIRSAIGFINTLIDGVNQVLDLPGVPGHINRLPVPSFHEGGVVGDEKGGSGRKGRRGALRDDEEMALLQKGEGVLPRNVVSMLGKERFEQLRSGKASLSDGRNTITDPAEATLATVRSITDAPSLRFRPPESDAVDILRPEQGGFIGDLVTAGKNVLVDAALDNAQKVVRGVMAAVEAALGPLGTPGAVASGPALNAGQNVIAWLDSLKSEASQAQPPASGGAGTIPAGGSTIDRLIGIVRSSGVPHRVTSTKRSGSGSSYHNVGRAVDFAGPQPSRDSPALARIFGAFRNVEGQLLELIYAGPQVSYNIKNGRRVGKYAQAIHHDHVHAALAAGGRLLPNLMQLVGENGPELVVPKAPALVMNQERTLKAMREQARMQGVGIADEGAGRMRAAAGSQVTVAEGAVQLSVTVTGADNPEAVGRRVAAAAGRELLAVVRAS